MFNFFNKPKKSTKAKKNSKNSTVKAKKASRPAEKRFLPPDKGIKLATEKLEETLQRLDANTTNNAKLNSTGKKKLIEQALAIHKDQSNLLNGLDVDSRRRLKALAMELMIFKRNG